jgi:predicted O-linked N-acetylglucosamine transferase (SPINDLY family)/SAM-dependent methyltransferase
MSRKRKGASNSVKSNTAHSAHSNKGQTRQSSISSAPESSAITGSQDEPQQQIVQLFDRAAIVAKERGSGAAIALYRQWLVEHPNFPLSHAVYYNLAVQQSEGGDAGGAEKTLQEVLTRYPGFHQARYALGAVQEKLGKRQEAVDTWGTMAKIIPATATGDLRAQRLLALNNRGRLLETMHRFAESEEALTDSLQMEPLQPSVIHHWVHLRQKQCEWPIYPPMAGLTAQQMLDATSALAMLDVTDDPAVQLAAAERFVREKVNLDLPPLCSETGYDHTRLRIGYLTSDISLHPVSMLMVELFELHDRNRFEIYAFEWSPEDGSDLRARVLRAMDHHFRIAHLSDSEAAQLIRQHEIDILFDLQGLTAGARPNILAARPATLQISYLGFPGTSGMPFIDYILCDRYIIPEEEARWYSERPLYLPTIFQTSDRKRQIAPTPTRAENGLPDSAFVFCAFNNNHKYTPELFDVWMKILQRVPGSLLWLLASNPSVEGNLRHFVAEHGIDQARIIFAPKVHPAVYLARYRLADLFLDCFPFNGGTTANDSFWMGLPMLTISGRSFASRMAGSLLTQLGLPELITTNFADYAEMAVALANDRPRLTAIRQRLQVAVQQSGVFAMDRIARDIETAISQAWSEKSGAAIPMSSATPAPLIQELTTERLTGNPIPTPYNPSIIANIPAPAAPLLPPAAIITAAPPPALATAIPAAPVRQSVIAKPIASGLTPQGRLISSESNALINHLFGLMLPERRHAAFIELVKGRFIPIDQQQPWVDALNQAVFSKANIGNQLTDIKIELDSYIHREQMGVLSERRFPGMMQRVVAALTAQGRGDLLSHAAIATRRLVDFGAGGLNPLALPILLYANGWQEVVACENFAIDSTIAAAGALEMVKIIFANPQQHNYSGIDQREMKRRLADLDLTQLADRFDAFNQASHAVLDLHGVKLVKSLADMADQSVDLMLSNSVLEHLMQPAEAFAQMGRVMAAGGLLVHTVDFSDHRAIGTRIHPFQFYYDGVLQGINGLRYSEVIALLTAQGFNCRGYNRMLAPEGLIDRLRLNGRYARMSDEDLRTFVVTIVAEK